MTMCIFSLSCMRRNVSLQAITAPLHAPLQHIAAWFPRRPSETSTLIFQYLLTRYRSLSFRQTRRPRINISESFFTHRVMFSITGFPLPWGNMKSNRTRGKSRPAWCRAGEAAMNASLGEGEAEKQRPKRRGLA